MYKIKELASLFGISTQAIRYYEKEGILLPIRRDEENGYRYYSNDEVNKLAQILQLRELGFHICQIKNFFNNEFDKSEKVKELKRIIDICNYQIMALESENNDYSIIHTKMMEYMNVIKRTIDLGEPITVLSLYGEMIEYATKNHLIPQDVYITFDKDKKSEKEILEMMISVENAVDGITIPVNEQMVACAFFTGNLYEINENIEKFLEAVMKSGYVPNGNVIQCYLTPCNPVSNNALIEFMVPIK